ncbi:MAG: hypothetical protein HXY24_00085 [Rubrivivax sp.]|nr:hypothetical protein [Rubrivivax sp.]
MLDCHDPSPTPARCRCRPAAIALSGFAALLLAGCEAPTKGFAGPGCYDYKGVRDAAIATEAECRALDMDWLTQPAPGMKRVQP